MFQFPSFALDPYVFRAESHAFDVRGFPIRKSPGHSLLGGSPRLIAALQRPSSLLGTRASTMHSS